MPADVPTQIDDPRLVAITKELIAASNELQAGQITLDELPSATDLAKKFGFKLDTVKKKLKILIQAGLLQATSFSPKRYRFNDYEWTHEDTPNTEISEALREILSTEASGNDTYSSDWDD